MLRYFVWVFNLFGRGLCLGLIAFFVVALLFIVPGVVFFGIGFFRCGFRCFGRGFNRRLYGNFRLFDLRFLYGLRFGLFGLLVQAVQVDFADGFDVGFERFVDNCLDFLRLVVTLFLCGFFLFLPFLADAFRLDFQVFVGAEFFDEQFILLVGDFGVRGQFDLETFLSQERGYRLYAYV